MRLLADADVAALIDPASALDLARRALVDQAAGASVLSSPSAMVLPGAPEARFKAARVGFLGAAGVRLLAHPAPGRRTRNYTVVFKDALPAGFISDGWLSCARTAAFGAVAAAALANPGPRVVTLFGTGAIATEIVPMLACALDVSTLRICSQRTESMRAFVAAHQPRCAFPILAEPEPRRAVEGADVILTITEARTPLVTSLPRGGVVVSMGSYNEVDFRALEGRLIVDDPEYAAEIGDGRAWIEQGHLTRATLAARIDARACEVIAGTRPGRRSPDERIVALMQGMAIGDVAFAAYALEAAERLGRGTVITLP